MAKPKIVCGVSWLSIEELKAAQAKATRLGYDSFSAFIREAVSRMPDEQ